MAELNDKLITYGNLSTFYDKLQEQGLGGNTIEDASVLPDAGENKNKLIRLESDDNVYVSELKSRTSTTTNRLPDEQQVDKAYLYKGDNTIYYYKGDYKIVCSDGEIDGYLWGGNYVTINNAETATENTILYYVSDGSFDNVNKTVTFDTDIASFKEENEATPKLAGNEVIYATYNAPEANQIGNATLKEFNNNYIGIYNGTEVTFIDENKIEQTGYKWIIDGETNFIVSDKSASEIVYIIRDAGEGVTVADTDTIFWLINSSDSSSTRIYLSNLYIPQLNVPDSEQVNNAYIAEGVFKFYKYKGDTLYTLTDDYQHTYYGYKWIYNDDELGTIFIFTQKKASDIYSGNAVVYLATAVDGWEYNGNNTYHESQGKSINYGTLDDFGYSYSTVKYQRTVVTEEWDWQPLTDNATNDYIDLMFDSEIKLIRAQEDDENYIDWLVNTSGETMEFNGQTYYKWVVWANDFNDGSGPAVEETSNIVLTNTLNVQLPFNSDSPEFEYRISIDGEEMLPVDYIHGDYTQKTAQ